MRVRKNGAGMVLLLALGWTTFAQASTHFHHGTIIGLTEDIKGAKLLMIRLEIGNYGHPEGDVFKIPLTDRTIFILDGKKSTLEEACQPGRTVTVDDWEKVMVSSQCVDPEIRAKADPAQALWVVDLPGALALTVESVDSRTGKSAGTRDITAGLRVLVDRRGERIAGVVVTRDNPRTTAWPYFDCDASGLKVADPGIRGELTVKLWMPCGSNRLAEPLEARYELALTATDGKPQGTFKGKCGAKEVSGKAGGELRRIPPRPEQARLWVHLEVAGARGEDGKFFAAMPMNADGSLREGDLLFSKGMRIGPATPAQLALVDGKLSGTLTLDFGGHGGPKKWTCRAQGALIGDRYVFGTLACETPEGKREVRFRAGISDARGAPIWGSGHPWLAEFSRRKPAGKPE